MRHRFAGFANAVVRYTPSTVDTGSSGGADNKRVDVNIESGSEFGKVPWSLDYSFDKESNDSGATSKFQELQGDIQYKFTRKFGVALSGGYELNEFAGDGGDSDGITWQAGVTWDPGPRTTVEGGLSKRFFGTAD